MNDAALEAEIRLAMQEVDGIHRRAEIIMQDMALRGTATGGAAIEPLLDALVVGWEFESVETLLFPNGGAEQDPQAWWNALRRVAKRLIGQGLVAPGQIVAVCRSTQGDVPDRTEYQRVYQPTAAHRAIYDTLFQEFVNIYWRNKGLYRRLNGRRAAG